MNDYRISSSTGDVTITAIDEKDARRIFRQTHTKEEANNAYAITLIRENTSATKAQERDALERIRAIVATLGPRSYVGTALEGCLEDAEVNIENDFGDSMKARWKDAERRVAEAAKETAAVKEELAQAQRALQSAEKDADFYRDKVIDSDDLTDIAQLLEDKIVKLAEACSDAANRIVEAATEPESAAFKSAVNDHRIAKGNFEYYTAIAQRIKHARGQ